MNLLEEKVAMRLCFQLILKSSYTRQALCIASCNRRRDSNAHNRGRTAYYATDTTFSNWNEREIFASLMVYVHWEYIVHDSASIFSTCLSIFYVFFVCLFWVRLHCRPLVARCGVHVCMYVYVKFILESDQLGYQRSLCNSTSRLVKELRRLSGLIGSFLFYTSP